MISCSRPKNLVNDLDHLGSPDDVSSSKYFRRRGDHSSLDDHVREDFEDRDPQE